MKLEVLVNEILEKARWYSNSYGIPPTSAISLPLEYLKLNSNDEFALSYAKKLADCKVLIGVYIYDDYSINDLKDFLYLSESTESLTDADIAVKVHHQMAALNDKEKFNQWKLEQAGSTFGRIFAQVIVHNLRLYPVETHLLKQYRKNLYERHNQTLFKMMALTD